MLTTSYKPHFCEIIEPVVALSVRKGNAVGGWLVRVLTSQGEKEYTALHFKKLSA